eukprot:scaffold1310_cov195-Alexandrium_tamarense.AAC.5
MKSRCMPPEIERGMTAYKDGQTVSLDWEEFPQLKSYMRCVRFKGAMKIDVWRILIVYKYGGIYSDIDHYPGSKLSETDPIQPDDEAFFLSDAWGRPSQWWFAMEPKELQNNERPNVVFVTGPDALKFGFGLAQESWDDNSFSEGLHTCKLGKTVKQLDMKEMVAWNETLQETRREELERQHGVKHWMDQKNSKTIEFGGSCVEYLY